MTPIRRLLERAPWLPDAVIAEVVHRSKQRVQQVRETMGLAPAAEHQRQQATDLIRTMGLGREINATTTGRTPPYATGR